MTDTVDQVVGGPGRPIVLDAAVAHALLDGSLPTPPALAAIDNAPLRISGMRRDALGSRWLGLFVDHAETVEVGDDGSGRVVVIRWPTVDGLVATRLAVFATLDQPRSFLDIKWRVLRVDRRVVDALLDAAIELDEVRLPVDSSVIAATSFRSVCVANGSVAVAEATLLDTANDGLWCIDEAEDDYGSLLVEIDTHGAWLELAPLLDPHDID